MSLQTDISPIARLRLMNGDACKDAELTLTEAELEETTRAGRDSVFG